MENITFNLSSLHHFGGAFYEFLELRKMFFVDQLGWDIPHDDRVEMDQYDNPLAHYSLVLRDGHVIGGARAMSTKSAWGSIPICCAMRWKESWPIFRRTSWPQMCSEKQCGNAPGW